MKKLLLQLALLLLFNSYQFCQTRSYGTNDFKQIQRAFYLGYSGTGEDTSEGGNFRQFKRWEMVWGPRLMPHHNFDTVFAQYKSFIKNFGQVERDSRVVTSNWEELGPNENGRGGVGRIDAIAFHPTDTNTIYVGCPSGGVWVSYNRGNNWQNLNTDQQLPSLGISSIAVDAINTDNIFLGTGDVDSEYVFSSGIYRSTDGGMNWKEAGINNLPIHFTIGKVLLHPTNTDKAFVATSIGIYKTTDRNSLNPVWEKVYPAGAGSFEYIRNISFYPNNPDVLYATGIDIISSNQSGDIDTWNRLATAQNGLDFENTPWANVFNGEEYVVSLNMTIAPQGDFLYVNCVCRDQPPPYSWQSDTYYHIFRYDILNDLWEIISTNGLTSSGSGITGGRTEMAVSPLDSKLVYCGGVMLKVYNPDTPDKPWKNVDFDSHIDFHELIFSPWDENVLFAGTDGGLYKKNLTNGNNKKDSNDGLYGKSSADTIHRYPTIELNNGLGISTMYNFGSSPIDPYQILAGYQDCGISYLKDSIWRMQDNPSDGFQCLMDASDIDLMYYTSWAPTNGSLYRSTYSCQYPIWQNIMNSQYPINETAWFGASLVADPANSRSFYQARINLWKVDNASTAEINDWYKITDVDVLTSSLWGNNNCVTFALNIAPSNPDYIYFTGVKIDNWATDFDANRVFKTSNGGGISANDWMDITPLTPGNDLGTYFITGIAVSSWDPNKIWISYSGYLEDYKVKYFDGSNWINYNEGLPNIPVNCIIYINGSYDALFVGTDVGVYYRDASLQQWEPFITKLPNVKVSWLELNYTNHKLRAGTFGRGLWETDIPSCDKIEDTIFITSKINWIKPQIITNNIVLEPGSRVTIFSTVSFAEDCKLIIKENAEVVWNGGSLSNFCGGSGAIPDNENNDLVTIKVFPNPVNEGEVTFEFGNTERHRNMELRCYDLLGDLVHSEKVYRYQGMSRVSTAVWPPGMYMAVIYSKGGAVGKCKFVVE